VSGREAWLVLPALLSPSPAPICPLSQSSEWCYLTGLLCSSLVCLWCLPLFSPFPRRCLRAQGYLTGDVGGIPPHDHEVMVIIEYLAKVLVESVAHCSGISWLPNLSGSLSRIALAVRWRWVRLTGTSSGWCPRAPKSNHTPLSFSRFVFVRRTTFAAGPAAAAAAAAAAGAAAWPHQLVDPFFQFQARALAERNNGQWRAAPPKTCVPLLLRRPCCVRHDVCLLCCSGVPLSLRVRSASRERFCM
jgi:hypothetical protein